MLEHPMRTIANDPVDRLRAAAERKRLGGRGRRTRRHRRGWLPLLTRQ